MNLAHIILGRRGSDEAVLFRRKARPFKTDTWIGRSRIMQHVYYPCCGIILCRCIKFCIERIRRI